MQNKTQIQELMLAAGLRANRRLGQHFLIDGNLMRMLVEAAQIESDDVVLEVGCGTGSLTQELAKKGVTVIAVEIDSRLAQIANEQLAGQKNVQILCTDILQNKSTISPLVMEEVKKALKRNGGRFLLVSNLPYHAASPLMFNLITAEPVADAMYVTVQKEVAERMTAGPDTKEYGALSILMAVTGQVKVIRLMPRTVFWPQPQVESAMVSYIYNRFKSRQIKDLEVFRGVVNFFMQHRRKMLKAAARFEKPEVIAGVGDWGEIFKKCDINAEKRPENLSATDYVKIGNMCSGA